LVKQVGGFRTHAVGEDFDLVVRMHRRLQEEHRPYHINFIAAPTCWTEVPTDWNSLARRARWHKGLIDALWPNRDMLFRLRYGRVGWLVLPYMWLFEFLTPVIELVGYATIILASVLGYATIISGQRARSTEQVFLSVLPFVWLRARHVDFHGFGTARRNDRAALRRLARSRPFAHLLYV